MDQHDVNEKTRANLAYFWSAIVAFLLFYILFRWGHEKEILTLIIGLIGGTILGGIFGIYFGGSMNKKPDNSPNIEKADTVNVQQ